MKLHNLVVLSFAVSLANGVAMAAEVPEFKALDANSDASVDADEFAKATEAGVEKTFKELDKDEDGKLTAKEYEAAKGEPDCE